MAQHYRKWLAARARIMEAMSPKLASNLGVFLIDTPGPARNDLRYDLLALLLPCEQAQRFR